MKWPDEISARPIEERDLVFLCRLYGSIRSPELAQTDWSDEQKQAFIQHQFDAQHHHYQTHYKKAEFWLLEKDGEPIGRLYVDRWPKEIRLVDIALTPESRGTGLGTKLLLALLAEGAEVGKPVSIHVEMFNPAMRLYERLGFVAIGDHGPYKLMQWSPP
jgi:GNAT superfamily N-acetyltransferase